jgi:hypothetical protein
MLDNTSCNTCYKFSYSVIITKPDRTRPSSIPAVKDYFLYIFPSQIQMTDVIIRLMHCSWDFAIGIEGKRQINTDFYKKDYVGFNLTFCEISSDILMKMSIDQLNIRI